jgi:hypothetical protein
MRAELAHRMGPVARAADHGAAEKSAPQWCRKTTAPLYFAKLHSFDRARCVEQHCSGRPPANIRRWRVGLSDTKNRVISEKDPAKIGAKRRHVGRWIARLIAHLMEF